MPPKKDKAFIQRLFTLQFSRKLLLVATGGLAFISGVFLLLRFFPEKAFEFSSPYFGTIKTGATTASNYLAEIEIIRQRVDGQRDTIDAAFANAVIAQRAASNATDQVVLAREQLRQIETNAAFFNLISRAYSDDRDAFDQLDKIYHQGLNSQGVTTNAQANYALGIVNSIIILHNLAQPLIDPPVFPSGVFYFENREVKENEVTIDDLNAIFQKYGAVWTGTLSGLLQWFSHCERFSKLQRLELLLSVRKTNKSLYICEWASREFCRLANLNDLKPLHPGNLENMENWLRENSSKIKD